jgi:hypothetical protein
VSKIAAKGSSKKVANASTIDQADQQAQTKKPTPDLEVEDQEEDTETSPTASPPITKKNPIVAPGAPKKVPAKKVKLDVAPKKAIVIGAGPKKGGFKGLQPKAAAAEVEKKGGRAKVVEKKKGSVAVKAKDEEEEEDGSEQAEGVGSDEE